jgi:hypothetical protein
MSMRSSFPKIELRNQAPPRPGSIDGGRKLSRLKLTPDGPAAGRHHGGFIPVIGSALACKLEKNGLMKPVDAETPEESESMKTVAKTGFVFKEPGPVRSFWPSLSATGISDPDALGPKAMRRS